MTIEQLADKAFDIYYNGGTFTDSEIEDYYSLIFATTYPLTPEIEAIDIMIKQQINKEREELTMNNITPYTYKAKECHQATTVFTHPTSKGSLTLSNKAQVASYPFLSDIDILVPLDSIGGYIWELWDNEIHYVPIDDFGILPRHIYLRETKRIADWITQGKRVLVFCLGGHGRTGYFGGGVLGMLGVSDPMELMRGVYCESSVETMEQLRELGEVIGIVYPCL